MGRRGSAASWRHAVEGGVVALARPDWGDAKWSYLYDKATSYRARGGDGNGSVPEAARRARSGDEVPVAVSGPVINAAVWTWEVRLYFWFGGIATGSSFIALACDAAGDHRSARIARMVALGAIGPGSPLLVLDLGRPSRFLNMLRIFKPRSPMSMGAWCLSAFSGAMGTAVLADGLGREKTARVLGAQAAVLGTYLGSYGVLLAATAVPVWNRSRMLLPLGVPAGHPTRRALGAIETLAMTTELGLSHLNEKRLGDLGEAPEEGRPGELLRFAKASVMGGLALRVLGDRAGGAAGHASSVLFLAAGLAFRFAWVRAGRTSAGDHEAVARTARRRA